MNQHWCTFASLDSFFQCTFSLNFQALYNGTRNKTGNILINVTLRRVRVTTVAEQKQEVFHAMSVSVALVIQHAKRKHRTIFSSVACLVLPYFSTLFHKHYAFWKQKLWNTKCMFWFSLQPMSKTFFISKKISEKYFHICT